MTFTPEGHVAAILAFERSLANALCDAGIIQRRAADAIRVQCDASKFDLEAIERDARTAGNIAIPIVEQLRALVNREDAAAATYVHWGATSQDAIDTGSVLQLRDALGAMEVELRKIIETLAALATKHAATPIVGRTLMQPAAPTTFGFKVATWLDALLRDHARLVAARQRVSVLQLGGAVGTLAALGDAGPRVAKLMASDLGLAVAPIAWHSSRDRVAEVATTLGLLGGSLGKIARDVSLLAQAEIDEVREPRATGRGRSSTMPQKQNPVGSTAILAAAIRAPHLTATMLSSMVQEHERALGGWQAEGAVLPELVAVVHDAVTRAAEVLAGLEIDAGRMLRNIDATRGLVFSEAVSFALMRKVGRARAKEIVDRAVRAAQAGGRLDDALRADPDARGLLTDSEIAEIFDVRNAIRQAEETARRIATCAANLEGRLREC